jgi:hypothetical protein
MDVDILYAIGQREAAASGIDRDAGSAGGGHEGSCR